MSNFERNVGAQRGATFFREGGELKFQFVVDPGTVVGPRAATERDKVQHAQAWEAYSASALDHDGDGEPGGSAPLTGEGYAGMTVKALKAHAAARSIDLGDAKKRDDVVAALELADEAAALAAPEAAT